VSHEAKGHYDLEHLEGHVKELRLLIAAVAALALLAVPAGALAKGHDRNHDRIPDRWEKRFHLSTTKNVAHKDPDHDGLANIAEFRDHTNPRKADSDDDGVGDGQEIEDHTNPDDAEDNDATEISGTVTAFDGTNLTIQRSDGGAPVSGVVNSLTEVECDDPGEATATMSEDGGDRSGSDGSGSDDANENENDGPGDDQDENRQCTIAVGDFVHEAKFVTDSSGNTFTKVELGR
jgi:hypothetical protein